MSGAEPPGETGTAPQPDPRVLAREVSAELSGTRGAALLWIGFLGGPAVWFLHLMVSYSLVRYVCLHGGMWLMHAVTAASLAGAAAVGWVAWRNWRRTGRPGETHGPGMEGRSRFLALAGLLFAGFSAAAIAVQGIPNFILPPCP